MSHENYVNKKENIILLSILLAGVLSFFNERIFFFITWILNILILSNIRRISFKNIFISLLRITLYFGHFFMFFLFYEKKENFLLKNIHNYIFFIIFFSFFLIHVIRYRDLFKIIFKFDYISSLTKKKRARYFFDFYSQFGSAICEELYFRYCIISLFYPWGVLSVFISTLYFFLSHYILPWSHNFTKKDFINQIIYGISMGSVFYYTNSILLCISLHLLFNVHTILLPIISYYYFYIKNSSSNANDEFEDIEI